MLDVKNTQSVNYKVTVKTETLMGEVCQAVKALDLALDQINFYEPLRNNPQANFHTVDASLPDVTLGEILGWVNNFACEEGPKMVQQEPAGSALIKARARQLAGMLKPLAHRVGEMAQSPTYRNDQPYVLTALAHPKVCWAFEELCQKMQTLADR